MQELNCLSNRQVLSVLLHNLRIIKQNLHESAVLFIKETVIFWQKELIPLREEHHSVSKLEKLYKHWRNLLKCLDHLSHKDHSKPSYFDDELGNLFDIAHGNALDKILLEEN